MLTDALGSLESHVAAGKSRTRIGLLRNEFANKIPVIFSMVISHRAALSMTTGSGFYIALSGTSVCRNSAALCLARILTNGDRVSTHFPGNLSHTLKSFI